MSNTTTAMDHLTDDTLLPYLDGELPAGERAEMEEHLARCAECRATLAALRSASERLSEALHVIDRPAPAIESAAAIATAGVRRGRRWIWRGAKGPVAWARAAALVIAAAGVAAAAVPGSPVREWLERAFGAAESPSEQDAIQADREAATVTDPSGVAVPLQDGAVRVRLTQPSPDAIVRVRLVDGERAAVRAEGARYRTGPGRIDVVQAGAGEVVIEIPRSAREARVEVDGGLVVLKEGSDLRLMTPTADAVGAELLFRAGHETVTPP